ncbi:MAG: hypothetical protein ACM3UU_02915 [Ignavibacteriales bacterium]
MYKCVNRKRWNIACIGLTLTIALIITLIITLSVKADAPVQYKKVVLQEGQGLFEIANENYISNDLNREVYEIRKHNGMYGKKYEPKWGEEIEIPVKENMK